jgi:peptidyl-prolyl cis-trans isomerase C
VSERIVKAGINMPTFKKGLTNSVVVLCVTVLLVACDQKSHEDHSSALSPSKESSILRLKNIALDSQAEAEQVISVYRKDAALASAILDAGMTDAELIDIQVEEYRNQLILSRYFERYLKQATSDAAVEQYYQDNISEFEQASVHVAHILFRVNSRTDKAGRDVLFAKANTVHQLLLQGQAFADVAKKYSQDKASSINGGDLGWVKQGAIAQEFSDKIFAMKVGELSEPFLTSHGVHIAVVVEEQRNIAPPLKDLKGEIRKKIISESKSLEVERLLKTIGFAEQ